MSDTYKPKVLVLDADQRSALAVTRSLGKSGVVNVFTADVGTTSLAGSSKYSQGHFQCPSSDKGPEEFLDWVDRAISKNGFDAIFPVTEITSQLLLMNKARLGPCKLPFASYDTVMSLADKGKLIQAARSSKIPVPESRLYNESSEVDINDINTFPVVVKPCLSRLWTGTEWIHTTVQIVYTREELSDTLTATDYLKRFPFMLQSYIPGHGAGLFAIYDSGNPIAYFSHRRLREKPPRGGVSVLSESAAVDPTLRRYAEALLTSVNWHGVAMVEFRVSEEGLPYLMEVNTRFWGSLQLAVDSGVNFPYLLWQITAGEEITTQEQYRTGQRLRWLLGDFDNLYLTCKDRYYSSSQKIRRLVEFCRPTFSQSRHEINRWEDLGPAWFELRRYLNDLIR